MVPRSLRAVEYLLLVILSMRGVAACNDELGCCSLLVTMLGNTVRVHDAFSTLVKNISN